MRNVIFGVGLLLLSATTVSAQQEAESTESFVQYDPLFWKDELKLNSDQCQKIREINGEYYESLFTAYEEVKDDHNALRSLADKSLEQRNQEIWETFHPKQRKRWKRMWQASTTQAPRKHPVTNPIVFLGGA